jgi:hypothetical protein
MSSHEVAFFTPYPFFEGQKIHIAEGPRRGDWEVVGVSERKVNLRCPVSFREFEWDRFCFHVDDRQISEWPQKD